MELGCVIMASGQGRRFGGNKLMAQLGGRPLVAWVIQATDGLFARRVVVTRHPEVERLCRTLSVPVVLHDLPSRSDTVRLGLEALGEGLSGCAFFSGDQPLISRQTVAALAKAAERDQESIWRVSCEGAAGAPVLFPSWTFNQLRSLPQGRGGQVILKQNPQRIRLVSARDQYEMMDVDTREDLEVLRRSLQKNNTDP